MGAYVTDRSTPLVAAAASNSNSDPQRRRLVLQYHQPLLQRKTQILLPHRLFDLFLKTDPEKVRF